MGVLFFVEQMNVYSYIGILLILISVLIVFIRKWRGLCEEIKKCYAANESMNKGLHEKAIKLLNNKN